MGVGGVYPSLFIMNNILRGCIRIGDMRNAYEIHKQLKKKGFAHMIWMHKDTKSLFLQGLSEEVNYTSVMNAYLDEGKWDDAFEFFLAIEYLHETLLTHNITDICCLPISVLYSVFIDGLDNKARTTEINKQLLMFIYNKSLIFRCSLLKYHLTLAKNCNYDEFKSLVELIESYGAEKDDLENAYDTLLKSKPDGMDDGIFCNLLVLAHCQYGYIVDVFSMYKKMVHHGFACHMIIVIAIIKVLEGDDRMYDELLWVIQNALRSCNLNDCEIYELCDEFDPVRPINEAFFDVLAEKVKDGPFLKFPASA